MDEAAAKQLTDEVKQELRREVESVRVEMQQIRDLVQDAIGRLTDSFGGMRDKSDQQLALVTSLTSSMDSPADEPAEEENEDSESEPGKKSKKGKQINIRNFVAETDKILRTFVDHIILVSRQSMEMVHRIDELAVQMNEISSLLKDINAIAELTNVLSLNARIVAARAGTAGASFSVVAGEVRKLAKNSHEFSDKIGTVVRSSKDNIHSAKNIIEVMASKDMSFAIESKGRVDEMMEEVSEIDRYTSETIANVSIIADELSESVNNAVMSLQFEDMVTQLSASMGRKFEVLERLLDVVDMNPLFDVTRTPKERIEQLRAALNQQIEIFEAVDRQAVQQSSMDEGDIDLF